MTPLETYAEIVFWISLALLFHTYPGLYIILQVAAGGRRPTRSAADDSDLPTLTVLVPAYNEEAVIAAKLDNLLQQDYPHGKLRLVVASDMSTDRTEETVRGYADRGVELVVMSDRSGKNGIDDKLIPTFTSEVAVVSDANTMLESDALRRMGEHYLNPRVGAVCGNVQVVPPQEARNIEREVTYRNFELAIRRLMGRLGRVIGGLGGFYSLRQQLYRPIGPGPYHEDIVVLMEVLAQGYRVEFAGEGQAVEETTGSIGDEFRHRIRLTSYTPSTLPRLVRLAWRAGPGALFLALSYKVLRWLSPYLWLVLLVTSSLLWGKGLVYTTCGGLMLAAVSLAFIGWLLDRFNLRGGPATSFYHFAVMNLASFAGLVRWLRGQKAYWTPMGR